MASTTLQTAAQMITSAASAVRLLYDTSLLIHSNDHQLIVLMSHSQETIQTDRRTDIRQENCCAYLIRRALQQRCAVKCICWCSFRNVTTHGPYSSDKKLQSNCRTARTNNVRDPRIGKISAKLPLISCLQLKWTIEKQLIEIGR